MSASSSASNKSLSSAYPQGGKSIDIADRRHHSCPDCGGNVYRIPRRTIDRVVSFFHRVHRYRCSTASCAWEGTLSAERVDVRAAGY